MSEHAPLLCNMGGPPRVTMVWNGREAGAAAGGPANGGWRTVRCDLDRPSGDCAGQRAHLVGQPGYSTAQQLLHADRVDGVDGGAEARDEAAADRELLERLQARIDALRLPVVVPVCPIRVLAQRQAAECVATDILTAAALQSRTIGRLLVRDAEPRLSRIELRAEARVPEDAARYDDLPGPSIDPRLSDISRRDIPWTFTWALRVYIDADLAARIHAFCPRSKE